MKKKFPARLCKRLLCLLLIINLSATGALAQVKISGKVTGNDGNGVPGVSVVIKNTNIGAATDANGNYVLNAPVKQGNYVLQFSGVGLKTRESSIRIGSDQNYSADAQLTGDPLGMDEIVITGTLGRTSKKQIGIPFPPSLLRNYKIQVLKTSVLF